MAVATHRFEVAGDEVTFFVHDIEIGRKTLATNRAAEKYGEEWLQRETAMLRHPASGPPRPV